MKTLKTLLLKLGLFLAPVCLCAALIVLIDPYNYFGLSHFINDDIKLNTSQRLDYCLWKSLEFRKRPADSILLGDSRMYNLDVRLINKATGRSYYNFAYGGGTLPEIIDTFWYATSLTKLKNVYIGLKNPAIYFINHNVVKSCGYNLYAQYLDRDIPLGQPAMDLQAFWELQLGPSTKNFYSSYSYPSKYIVELRKISDYCRLNDIKLSLIMFPTHTDLQRKVGEYGLSAAERIFRRDLERLGTVYDFDYDNEYTSNRANFTDPYHYRDPQLIIDEVWGGKRRYGRVTGGIAR